MKDITTYMPGSLDEALGIVAARGAEVTVIAGGTDVVINILEGKIDPPQLLDITRLDELRFIRDEGEYLNIGALTTHREIERSELIGRWAPPLREGCYWLGSPQLRSLSTIGGNLVNASPVADSTPPLMVLDATLTLRSAAGERRVPVRDFFRGPGESVRRSSELLTGIRFRKMSAGEVSFYERLGQRRLLSIAKVGVALKARRKGSRLSDVSVALGAVAPTVIMAPRTAAFLEGKPYSEEVAREAARIAEGESRGITDIRSTASYRNRMAGALLRRGLARVMGD